MLGVCGVGCGEGVVVLLCVLTVLCEGPDDVSVGQDVIRTRSRPTNRSGTLTFPFVILRFAARGPMSPCARQRNHGIVWRINRNPAAHKEKNLAAFGTWT